MKPALTVLIITDEEETHSGIGWPLQRRGYRAIEVVGGRPALEYIKSEAIGLILIDRDHPLSESLTLARSLREQADLAGAKVVIVTNESNINSQGHRPSGSNEYLIDRNDSASIMNLLASLDALRYRPIARAHKA